MESTDKAPVAPDKTQQERPIKSDTSSFHTFQPTVVKTKLIALSPCSDNAGIMWTEPKEQEDLDLNLRSTPTNSAKPEADAFHTSANTTGKDKSPLEATFTSPKESLEESEAVRLSLPKKKRYHGRSEKDKQKSPQRKKSADYTALEFASSSSQTNSLTMSMNGEDDKHHLTDELIPEDEPVAFAILALFFSAALPLWSLGMAYWHFIDGKHTASLMSLILIAVSALAVHIAYFSASLSPKLKIWKTCKTVFLLTAIPGLPTVILSLCNCVFAVREAQSRTYERPWKNTRYLFLVESLAVALPQCVLSSLLIGEDPQSLPSIKGYVMVGGIAVLSFAVAFARFRYDLQNRPERFGGAWQKPIRFLVIWAHKGLWVVTYTIAILTFRIVLPSQTTVATAVAVASVFLSLEVPVVITMSPIVNRMAGNLGDSCIGLLMTIPQTVGLVALILWVNLDPKVYDYDSGCLILGLFFWNEVVILTGWLYDRCMAVEMDFLPIYPHFFVDLIYAD